MNIYILCGSFFDTRTPSWYIIFAGHWGLSIYLGMESYSLWQLWHCVYLLCSRNYKGILRTELIQLRFICICHIRCALCTHDHVSLLRHRAVPYNACAVYYWRQFAVFERSLFTQRVQTQRARRLHHIKFHHQNWTVAIVYVIYLQGDLCQPWYNTKVVPCSLGRMRRTSLVSTLLKNT